MSQEILIQELRSKSCDNIREMWREAEEKAESLRLQQEKKFAEFKKGEEGRLQEVKRRTAAPIIHQAEIKALQIVDDAVRKLSGRLYARARDMLPGLREADYPAFFAELAEELPSSDIQSVTVNGQDEDIARSSFPEAEIQTDPDLSGGFIASGDNGRYRVINTLEHRLEKAWPYALPALLREVTGEKDD